MKSRLGFSVFKMAWEDIYQPREVQQILYSNEKNVQAVCQRKFDTFSKWLLFSVCHILIQFPWEAQIFLTLKLFIAGTSRLFNQAKSAVLNLLELICPFLQHAPFMLGFRSKIIREETYAVLRDQLQTKYLGDFLSCPWPKTQVYLIKSSFM